MKSPETNKHRIDISEGYPLRMKATAGAAAVAAVVGLFGTGCGEPVQAHGPHPIETTTEPMPNQVGGLENLSTEELKNYFEQNPEVAVHHIAHRFRQNDCKIVNIQDRDEVESKTLLPENKEVLVQIQLHPTREGRVAMEVYDQINNDQVQWVSALLSTHEVQTQEEKRAGSTPNPVPTSKTRGSTLSIDEMGASRQDDGSYLYDVMMYPVSNGQAKDIAFTVKTSAWQKTGEGSPDSVEEGAVSCNNVAFYAAETGEWELAEYPYA